MELTGVRSKIWNEGDYPPVSSSGGYLRGYICTIWDLVWPHITLWFRPGLDLTLARPLSPMSHTGRGMGSTLPRTLITFIWWQSFNLNTLSQQQPGSVIVMCDGPWSLYSGHWTLPRHTFLRRGHSGLTKGAAAWYYSNCLQLYQPWGGTNISSVIRTHFIS